MIAEPEMSVTAMYGDMVTSSDGYYSDEFINMSDVTEVVFPNTTFNVSLDSVGNLGMYEFFRTEQLVFLSILFVFIVVGNSSVLVAICLSNKRKSRMNYFIMHLAIADLMVGLVNVLTDIIWKWTIEFQAGLAVCKTARYGQGLVMYSSTYMLVALSIDRLDAIARPLHFSTKVFRSKVLALTAWMLAFVFAIPMMFINNMVEKEGIWQCWISFPAQWHWKIYISMIAIILFIIPAFIISFCYIVIVISIWSKGKLHVAAPRLAKKRLVKTDLVEDVAVVDTNIVHQSF